MSDSNLQYVTSTTFLLFTYAKYLSVSNQVVRCGNVIATPAEIRTHAKRQVQSLTGDCYIHNDMAVKAEDAVLRPAAYDHTGTFF